MSRCSGFLLFIAIYAIPFSAFGYGDCRFTFSTALVVASGYTENPLFDITKPETMHGIGAALRYELVTLGKDPSRDNIDALHAQLPQIVKWVKDLPERIKDLDDLTDPYYQQRADARAKLFPKVIKRLETALRVRRMTYQHYLELQYRLAILTTRMNPLEDSGYTVSTYSEAIKNILSDYQNIALATFDKDPSHLDFIRSTGNYFWVAVKTTITPDQNRRRAPVHHLIHDANGHALGIAQRLTALTPYGARQIFDLKEHYLSNIRPDLSDSQKPMSDALLAHLFHDEPVYPFGKSELPESGLMSLIRFASTGANHPFVLAAEEIVYLRNLYINYRQELPGTPVEVEQNLKQMALYLEQRFQEIMEFQPHLAGSY